MSGISRQDVPVEETCLSGTGMSKNSLPHAINVDLSSNTDFNFPFFTETEKLIWAAGFFEGEGTVHITKQGYLDVKIANTSYKSLKLLQSISGGRIYKYPNYRKKNGDTTSIYRLCIFGLKAYEFLKKILPYMKFRRRQVELAIEFYDQERKNVNKYRSLINSWSGKNEKG